MTITTTDEKMPKHTPGPWDAEWSTRSDFGKEKGWHVANEDIFDADGTIICETSDDSESAFADARLISTAPDGLELALLVQKWANRPDFTMPTELSIAANVVIEKYNRPRD